MGYDTWFRGGFNIWPELCPEHFAYLRKFSQIRHVKRNLKLLKNVSDPEREAVGLPIGEDGLFYVGGKSWFEPGKDEDASIVNFNHTPSGAFSFYCCWTPTEDRQQLVWDGSEKFYYYVEWLQFVIDNFFKPWGYVLNGSVDWHGEDFFDTGTIVLNNNQIEVFGDIAISENSGVARRLRVFLCHCKDDKKVVRKLHNRLEEDSIEPWLDEEDLIPGQDWQREIKSAIEKCDLFIVCLSRKAVDKVGFVQKEIKFALDVADLQPEGRLFIIPLKLEECDVPDRLKQWHWINYFEKDGYYNLRRAMGRRAEELSHQ